MDQRGARRAVAGGVHQDDGAEHPRLREGRGGQIDIVAKDEMGELADAFNDMAASIQERERDITRLAKCDPATGLPNRSAFEDHLQALRDSGVAEQGGVAIVCIGVDRYAHIRAVWGVAYGHTLMARVQDILGGIFAKAYIARLSGDTLGLCLTPCGAGQAQPLCQCRNHLWACHRHLPVRSPRRPIAPRIRGQGLTIGCRGEAQSDGG